MPLFTPVGNAVLASHYLTYSIPSSGRHILGQRTPMPGLVSPLFWPSWFVVGIKPKSDPDVTSHSFYPLFLQYKNEKLNCYDLWSINLEGIFNHQEAMVHEGVNLFRCQRRYWNDLSWQLSHKPRNVRVKYLYSWDMTTVSQYGFGFFRQLSDLLHTVLFWWFRFGGAESKRYW
jgi:hypothetical protein